MAFLKSTLLALLASSLPAVVLAGPGAAMRARAERMSARGEETVNSTLVARQFTSDAPYYYSGPYTSFPAMSTWVDFSTMFNDYEQYMVDAGSTWDDVGRMAVAIEDAAADIGVDERVILGIILEESSGYVGVGTTYDADGEPTGGLMQASGCTGYPGQNDLPQSDTSYMVNCGTQHYKENLEDFGDLWATSSIYPALREYNTGSVDQSNLSDAPDGTNPYYVSDIAQRMQGYVF